ncbi:hypothetical protein [Rhodococcus sp. NPDC058521]|uniref:CG0192-related protein n=1 Tax=Rhodococcus sp. NPDC058521 TaxID=3346536 RepID=UPI0036652517
MALVYNAELQPSKLDLIASWLPSQDWYGSGEHPELEQLASYRFDDPDGEVGIETHLLRDGEGSLFQVPLTYRSAPLTGADDALVGTMQHSVLGERWVYDAVHDPVYVSVVASVIASGGTEADQFRHTDTGPQPMENTAHVVGSGDPVDGKAGSVELVRRPATDGRVSQSPRIDGWWDGQPNRVTLLSWSQAAAQSGIA